MAKAVFRPGELTVVESRVVLEPPGGFTGGFDAHTPEEELEEVDEIGSDDEYSGPTRMNFVRKRKILKYNGSRKKKR